MMFLRAFRRACNYLGRGVRSPHAHAANSFPQGRTRFADAPHDFAAQHPECVSHELMFPDVQAAFAPGSLVKVPECRTTSSQHCPAQMPKIQSTRFAKALR